LFFDVHLEGDDVDVLLDHEFIQKIYQILICSEFDPNVDRGFLLDVADHRVELEVFLRLGQLHHLETHRTFAFVVKFDLLPINVAQQTNLHIVTLPFDPHRHLHALALDRNRNRGRVQRILRYQKHFELERTDFFGGKVKNNSFLDVALNLSSLLK
jgi:hypothetical protein